MPSTTDGIYYGSQEDDNSHTRRMYNTGYISLVSTTPRTSRRRIFYIIVGLVLGCALTFVFIRKSQLAGSTTNHKAITEYRLGHYKFKPTSNSVVDRTTHHNYSSVPSSHNFSVELQNNNTKQVVDGHANVKVNVHNQQDGKDYHHSKGHATFNPTNEWQSIPENVILPAGLDIKFDFKTGERMARLHQNDSKHENLPVLQENVQPSPPSVSGTLNNDPKFKQQVSVQKTVIEERLDQITSTDHKVQEQALELLDVEAHRLPIGAAITHARNFGNLLDLVTSSTRQLRLDATGIIAACLHNNAAAADGALMSKMIAKLVEQLPKEEDSQARRRIIAILTYVAESNLPGTLHQFVDAHGFEALRKVASRGLEGSMFERTMIFLATISREESNQYNHIALAMLERYLPTAQKDFDKVSLDAFQPVCQVETLRKPVLYTNLVTFCKNHVK